MLLNLSLNFGAGEGGGQVQVRFSFASYIQVSELVFVSAQGQHCYLRGQGGLFFTWVK